MHPTIVTTRDIVRNYKKVFEQVQKTNQPALVMNQKKPQVGIVSIEDFKKLEDITQQTQYKQSTKSLLEVAKKVREILKDEKLPRDLSVRHDYYLYEEDINR